jgi:hypothetical protein
MTRLAPALLLLLAACEPGGTDRGPGGVTADEARALDEAAEMLEQQRLEPEDVAVPQGTASPEPAS